MKLSARVFYLRGKHLFFLLLGALLFSFSALPTYAQSSEHSNTNPDVPNNQHTKSQIAIIENSAAIICQIAGIDIINPEKGCLGVNQTAKKIGYAPVSLENNQQVGGLLGMSTQMIGMLYQPPASGTSYVASLMDNFGIVKKTYAQEKSGYDALSPLLSIWEVSRNITYALLVLVFVIIGLGIMLRVKIDPRTSMSIQNQIPRIVIAILLITFSYSIIGFMVDLMWLGTYVGINSLSGISNETICSDGLGPELTIRESAYANLLNSPFAFMNDILKHPEPNTGSQCDVGIKYLSLNVSYTAGTFVSSLIQELFGIKDPSCGFLDFSCNVENALANFIGWIGQVLMLLITFLALLIVMFRLWWQLLRAYALVIFYTILGPFWILLGLLPNSERNFNSWLRTVTAKLATFPAAALMILIARLVLDKYNQASSADPTAYFAPPMVGNPVLGQLGPLLAFAILLITPEILNMLNDALKAPASKYVGPAITGGVAAGFAAGAPASLLARRLTRYDNQGNPRGAASIAFHRLAAHSIRTGASPEQHDASQLPRRQRVANRLKGAVGKGLVLATGGRTDNTAH